MLNQLFPTVYKTDWLKFSNSEIRHPIGKLLVSINQSSYLIYSVYKFFKRAKET